MKIKFNWGTGITIVIILFLGTVFWRIYLASEVKINLVSKDYYPKGLEYKSQIDREANNSALSEKATVEKVSDVVTVTLPSVFKGERLTISHPDNNF